MKPGDNWEMAWVNSSAITSEVPNREWIENVVSKVRAQLEQAKRGTATRVRIDVERTISDFGGK